MEFEFATATRVVFGPGRLAELPGFLAAEGLTRVLLVTGRSAARAAPLIPALDAAGIAHTRYAVEGEPTLDDVRTGASACRAASAQGVVAFGGGGAIDAGKAIAALASNPGDVLDYVEVIGRGAPLVVPPLPFVAVPTTAGTGAEVTRNAVLGSREHGVKVSLRSPAMLPRLALVDPELLRDAPRSVVRASGLDAFSQLVEAFVTCRANPLTTALARDGLMRSHRALRRAVLHGASAEDREQLALASLFSGLCLANAGLGAVHGFAAPLGGMFEAPHGAVCAALLAPVMAANVRALSVRAPHGEALARFRELAALLTGSAEATPDDGARYVAELCRELEVPGLAAYGVTSAHLDALVHKAERASSMRGNPLALTTAELRAVAEAAL